MRAYSIVVDPDPEGGFTVTVPSLPGCITQGETVEECVSNPNSRAGEIDPSYS